MKAYSLRGLKGSFKSSHHLVMYFFIQSIVYNVVPTNVDRTKIEYFPGLERPWSGLSVLLSQSTLLFANDMN